MKRASIRSKLLLTVVLAGVALSLGAGPASTAVDKVREGIGRFAAGDFDAAAKAFTEADVAEPDNQTVAFDRACVAAAVGDVEEAVELFRQAALARETELAARAHYNLGCLSAEQGRATLGEDPVAAAPEQRQQGTSHLLAAVGHYRDCLKLDVEHSDARHNLELIRLFLKHIQSQWDERDRKQAREEMGLLEFLSMIEQRQTTLRSTVGGLTDEPDSPQRRQAASEAAADQRELQEEIEPLKEKIAAEFEAAGQSGAGGTTPPQPPPDDSQLEEAQRLLTQLADEAFDLMTDAAASVDGTSFPDAELKQRDVLDRLNQIYMAAAPFPQLLQRATQHQEQLVSTSEAAVPAEPSTNETDRPDESHPENDEQDGAASVEPGLPEIDGAELQWQQSRVTDWSRMLGLKAESELPGVEAQLQSISPDPSSDDDSNTADADQAETADNPDDPTAQLKALRASLEKAVELSPRIVDHSEAAAGSLGQADVPKALPDQQEALKLLREIAEPLAQQNEQQQDQQQEDEQQDDGNEQNQQQQQQPNPEEEQQREEQSAQQRAESVLRRARQREREHRDLEKQLRQLIGGRVPVDRDW